MMPTPHAIIGACDPRAAHPPAAAAHAVRTNFRALGRVRASTCTGMLIAASLLLSACSDPLLSPRDERTPFARYDAVRSQHSPQYIEDEFGQRQPNLRGRLEPKD